MIKNQNFKSLKIIKKMKNKFLRNKLKNRNKNMNKKNKNY